MNRKVGEWVLWGIREGNEGWQEELLIARPTRELFPKVRELAARDGFGRFREAWVDISTPPDFTKTLNTNSNYRRVKR